MTHVTRPLYVKFMTIQKCFYDVKHRIKIFNRNKCSHHALSWPSCKACETYFRSIVFIDKSTNMKFIVCIWYGIFIRAYIPDIMQTCWAAKHLYGLVFHCKTFYVNAGWVKGHGVSCKSGRVGHGILRRRGAKLSRIHIKI